MDFPGYRTVRKKKISFLDKLPSLWYSVTGTENRLSQSLYKSSRPPLTRTLWGDICYVFFFSTDGETNTQILDTFEDILVLGAMTWGWEVKKGNDSEMNYFFRKMWKKINLAQFCLYRRQLYKESIMNLFLWTVYLLLHLSLAFVSRKELHPWTLNEQWGNTTSQVLM